MSKHEAGELDKARDFLQGVAKRLDLEPAIVSETMPYLLGMTKHVAHDAIRPAAPLSAFLVGLAVGSAGDLSQDAVRERIATVEQVVKEFADGQS